MKELVVMNGILRIPRELDISESKRRLAVKTPWVSEVRTMPRGSLAVTIRQWMRHRPEKPYVPEGQLEIDGERYQVREVSAPCRACGCTQDHACPGGCSWAEPDLCSKCAGKVTP